MKTPKQQVRKPVPKPTKIIQSKKQKQLDKLTERETKNATQSKG